MNADDTRTVQKDADGMNRPNTAAAICNDGGGNGDFAFSVSGMLSAGLVSAAAFSVRPVALRPAGSNRRSRYPYRLFGKLIDDDCRAPRTDVGILCG